MTQVEAVIKLLDSKGYKVRRGGEVLTVWGDRKDIEKAIRNTLFKPQHKMTQVGAGVWQLDFRAFEFEIEPARSKPPKDFQYDGSGEALYKNDGEPL